MYGCKDAVEQITRDSHLGELEGDGAGVADDPCTNFDQPGLQAGQRPVGYLLGQISALQKNAEIVGQRMELQMDLILGQSLARQPGPVDCVLAFLDMLLGGAALVIDAALASTARPPTTCRITGSSDKRSASFTSSYPASRP